MNEASIMSTRERPAADKDKMEEEPAKIGGEVEWRQRCISEFGLKEFPDEWKSDSLVKMSQASSKAWEKYYHFRVKYAPENSNIEDEDDYSDDENWPLKKIRAQVKEAARSVYPEFDQHCFSTVNGIVLEEYQEPRSIDLLATIFSPYALPHVLQFSHFYHYRTRYGDVEYHCRWDFRLVSFFRHSPDQLQSKKIKGAYLGDFITREKHMLFPFRVGTSTYAQYSADEETENLCCNGYMETPIPEIWKAIEDIHISNFNVSTVSRMKRWLFAPRAGDADLSDFDFLRLLFMAVGSNSSGNNFDSVFGGDYGHCLSWEYDNEELLQQAKDDGAIDEKIEEEDVGSILWLEYQARLVSSALRPIDRYYQPYNELEEKAEWGERLLLQLEQSDEGELRRYLEEGEELEDLHRVPWILWYRALSMQHSGRSSQGEDMEMRALMNLLQSRLR